MQKISLALAVSLMIVCGVIGLGVGYVVTPQYQQAMYTRDTMGLGIADRLVDLRYIDRMIAHHRGAILLAEQELKVGKRKETRDLALEITQNEPKLIAELYTWKRAWYKDTSPVRDPLVANLGGADDSTDLRFLNALIAHHQSGVEMTKEIRGKSSRKEILDNADAVENFLLTSGVMLKEWRLNWYNVK